ncbi:FlgK family flagellar hook-associated protein [Alloyangia pacifica]|uniref:Flagellar hook-associated protein 1 n=1 Tax=Alloyangia pacifica TaxID=311180 RepID=A0A1I6U103_9RHOB|nr:flagellar basal body rod C-terminal domain-containing protein [Alloyangia pacifica]SDH32908.1 flagellar hook-associated protein 1 FlgK [Alloyangia pacifica]SFS95100.1 flagellar hook-associated protein 1 FlgK [Alloyangia pacifica]
MSLTGALSNATSGLTANSRAATVVASNIANATTENYGRRVLDTASRGSGSHGGVTVLGVTRLVDSAVLSDRRLSDAAAGFASDMEAFATRFGGVVGESGAAGSLTGRLSVFETALVSAAADPASTQRLQTLAQAGLDFTDTLNTLSFELQQSRVEADASIARQVDRLNIGLARVRALNEAISAEVIRKGDAASLKDERQRVIDELAEIVPLRVVERPLGAQALYAASGTVLLDPTINSAPAEIGFTATGAIDAAMTLAGGALSELSLNGVAISSSNSGPLGGGTLGAQLQIRDVLAPELQAGLDGLSRDLIDRFAPGGPDTTLAAGDPGLFTDAGAAFDPLDEAGLAGRITLNALVDPEGGGPWRLRDGLGAASQGPVGDATLITGYMAAMEALTVPASASLGTGSKGFAQHVAEFHSAMSLTRVRAEDALSFTQARNTALREIELSKGVDTDAELQALIRIEQSYAANARVVSVVDELMQRLLAI